MFLEFGFVDSALNDLGFSFNLILLCIWPSGVVGITPEEKTCCRLLGGRVGIFFSLKSMTIRKRKFEGSKIEVLNGFSFSIRRFPPFDSTIS